MKNIIYYSIIPKNYIVKSFSNKERQIDIDTTTDTNLKKQKSAVWELLAIAINEQLNIDINSIDFTKTGCGKWIAKDFHFSLSHTNNAVCVAISNKPVGVDIESITKTKLTKELIEKVLTENEKPTLSTQSQIDIVSLWTKKESIFKIEGKNFFNPKVIDTTIQNTQSKIILNNEYVISVATKEKNSFQFKKKSI